MLTYFPDPNARFAGLQKLGTTLKETAQNLTSVERLQAKKKWADTLKVDKILKETGVTTEERIKNLTNSGTVEGWDLALSLAQNERVKAEEEHKVELRPFEIEEVKQTGELNRMKLDEAKKIKAFQSQLPNLLEGDIKTARETVRKDFPEYADQFEVSWQSKQFQKGFSSGKDPMKLMREFPLAEIPPAVLTRIELEQKEYERQNDLDKVSARVNQLTGKDASKFTDVDLKYATQGIDIEEYVDSLKKSGLWKSIKKNNEDFNEEQILKQVLWGGEIDKNPVINDKIAKLVMYKLLQNKFISNSTNSILSLPSGGNLNNGGGEDELQEMENFINGF